MNINNKRPEFLRRLSVIKPQLPIFYSKIIQEKFPTIKRDKIYSIVAGDSTNMEVLEALELIAKNYNASKSIEPQQTLQTL